MSSFESPDHGHTHIGRIGFVSQHGKSTKQALWSVAKPELANTKGQGCYCQPKKTPSTPEDTQLKTKPQTLPGQQPELCQSSSKTKRLPGKYNSFTCTEGLPIKNRKERKKTKEERHGQQQNYIRTTPPSRLRLINTPAFCRDQSRWLHHDGRIQATWRGKLASRRLWSLHHSI